MGVTPTAFSLPTQNSPGVPELFAILRHRSEQMRQGSPEAVLSILLGLRDLVKDLDKSYPGLVDLVLAAAKHGHQMGTANARDLPYSRMLGGAITSALRMVGVTARDVDLGWCGPFPSSITLNNAVSFDQLVQVLAIWPFAQLRFGGQGAQQSHAALGTLSAIAGRFRKTEFNLESDPMSFHLVLSPYFNTEGTVEIILPWKKADFMDGSTQAARTFVSSACQAVTHYGRADVTEIQEAFAALPSGTTVPGVFGSNGVPLLHAACGTGVWWDGSPVGSTSCAAARLALTLHGLSMAERRAYQIEPWFSTPDLMKYAAALFELNREFVSSPVGQALQEFIRRVTGDGPPGVAFPAEDSTVPSPHA